MKVTVKLFASLRTGRFDARDMEFPDGATAGLALEAVGLGAGDAAIVFVNSRHAALDRALREGDIIAAFPPIGGG
jgi:sulfur-carrier protein